MQNRAPNVRARKVVKAKLGFSIHLTAFLLVNALLVGINFATSTTHYWFVWPLLGWGIGLICHALALLCVFKGRCSATR